jgi:hypothetical protein
LEWSIDGRGAELTPAERQLAFAADALGVGAVERQPGEELGGHAAALAGVVAAARRAGAGRLRLAQLRNSSLSRQTLGEPAGVADGAGLELVVDHERAGVDVADRVDEAHHPAGAAHVEPGQRLAERVEVEERVAGEHVLAVGEQPVGRSGAAGRWWGAARATVGAATRRAQPGDAELGAVAVGERLELVELVDVVAGDDHRDLERSEAGRTRGGPSPDRAVAYEPSPRTASLVTASVPSRLIWMSR